MQLRTWVSGVYSEVEFWRVWMRTGGAFWRDQYRRRLRADVPLDDQAAKLLPVNLPAGEIKVLDVGSGPLSGLGTMHKGERLAITAADPLANAYRGMYEEFRVKPPIQVKLAFAEDLTSFFQKDEFDLVVCQNALDHTFDPWRALRQMIEISKPGGSVLLRHDRNEAEKQKYSGLHQWNIDSTPDGQFTIWNRQSTFNVSELLAGQVQVTLLDSTPQHLVVALSKTPGTSLFDADDAKARLRELLTEMADTATSLGREGLFMRSCFALQTYGRYLTDKIFKLR